MFNESAIFPGREKKPVAHISDISFDEVPFREIKRKEQKHAGVLEIISTVTLPCEINGNIFYLQLQKVEGKHLSSHKLVDEFLSIELRDDREVPVLEATVTFRFESDEDQVKLSIGKKKSSLSTRDPKHAGVGIEVYKCMLVYIQEKSDRVDQSLQAVVRKNPNGISDESWDNTFRETLETEGYVEENDEGDITWKKIYEPSKK